MMTVNVEHNKSGAEQEGSFANATLQAHNGMAFSIACHVKVPDTIQSPAQLQTFLTTLFMNTAPAAQFEIQIGEDDLDMS